ncbi:MAG: DUF308 domain-containing protein [Alistipes sp.]|nr:DUF308 domain-containing protein [Alistipes sp.]
MKSSTRSLWGNILAIVLGVILTFWPDEVLEYVIQLIGLLFLIPGIIVLIGYLTRKRDGSAPMQFPIVGTGSILLGLWLLITPTFFVNILMYVLGALLIAGGIQQMVLLSLARRIHPVSGALYIIPTLILICGLVILFNPFKVVSTLVMLFGVSCVVYGAFGLFSRQQVLLPTKSDPT